MVLLCNSLGIRYTFGMKNISQHFKGKNWIDWVKALVAFDIAIVGISLVFQNEMHILANMFGVVSRLIFGILYIIVAIAILKGVFPDLFEEFKEQFEDDETEKPHHKKHTSSHVSEMIEKGAHKAKDFVHDRAQEAKQELNKILD